MNTYLHTRELSGIQRAREGRARFCFKCFPRWNNASLSLPLSLSFSVCVVLHPRPHPTACAYCCSIESSEKRQCPTNHPLNQPRPLLNRSTRSHRTLVYRASARISASAGGVRSRERPEICSATPKNCDSRFWFAFAFAFAGINRPVNQTESRAYTRREKPRFRLDPSLLVSARPLSSPHAVTLR